MTAKQLREQRAKLVADSRKILDTAEAEKRELNAEENQKWADLHAEERKIYEKITRLEKQEKLESELAEPADDGKIGRSDRRKGGGDGPTTPVTEEHRALAIQAWFRAKGGLDLTEEHQEAVKLTGTNLRRRHLDLSLRKDYRSVRRELRSAAQARWEQEYRAMSVQTGSTGAYTVPQGFVNNLEVALLAFANLREFCDVMRTDSGQDLPWPSAKDTQNKGEILGENTSIGSSTDPTFGQVIFRAYKYSSKLILIPAELLEDTAFSLTDQVGSWAGERIGRIQADHHTTGLGGNQPIGVVTAAALGVTAALTTAFTADEIYNLKHSVDPAYRTGSRFMMHDNVLLFIKKLKDGIGRYLWQASLAGGAPDTLDGDPIAINQSMASAFTTGQKLLLYGQFSKYKIRDVNTVRMRWLNERYADTDQIGAIMFMRSDANLLDAGTNPIKYLKLA